MSKRALISLVILGGFAAVAVATNPAPDAHRARIREAVAERSPLAGVLGIGAITAFSSSYHSWVLASYTTVNGRVASIGALGAVMVLEPRQ